MIKISNKACVPDCLALCLQYCKSKGVECKRLHFDNEAVLHSPAAKEATVTKYAPMGVPDESRYSLFHGAKASIKMDRAFGCLTYFALEHEFNATAQTLAKPHDRDRRGLHVGWGGDGSMRDRRQPACVE